MERRSQEGRLFVPKNYQQVDYDNEADNDWANYIHRNLAHNAGKDTPYPGSYWSYARNDSAFSEEEDLTGLHSKGWKRSDDSVYDEVCEALYQSSDVDASCIEVNVLNGVVSLSGTVNSQAARKAAVDAIEQLPGVWDVHNQISVSTN